MNRIKICDWLWYTFGMALWSLSAGNHPEDEVKRRLGWMTLDSRENNQRWRDSEEGRKWLIKRAHENRRVREERY